MFWLGLVVGVPASAGDVDTAGPTEKVAPIHQVAPRSPAAARGLGLSDVECSAEVHLRPTGVPRFIRVEDCFDPFADATANALSLWRWPNDTPPQTLSIRYKISDSSLFQTDRTAFVVVRDPTESPDATQFFLPGIDVLVRTGDGRVVSPVLPFVFLGEIEARLTERSDLRASRIVTEVLGDADHQQQVRVNCDLLIDVNEKGKVMDVSSETCPRGTLDELSTGIRRGRFTQWKGTPPGTYRLPLTLSAIRGANSDLAYFRLGVAGNPGASSF